MTPAADRVHLLKDEQAYWDWDSSQPSFNLRTPHADHGFTVKCDPFPCYTHPAADVIQQVEKTERAFPIQPEVFYFVLPYETLGRTNGTSTHNYIYDKEERMIANWDGVIYLSGKRIPIMPAMTRYLIAHEYGHQVDDWISKCKHGHTDRLYAEYAEMRGLPKDPGYGGRKWHTNTGEIIANDFRIVVCGVEPEFWPHPHCAHPLDSVKVRDWWYEAMLKYSVSK